MKNWRTVVVTATMLTSFFYLVLSMICLAIVAATVNLWTNGAEIDVAPLVVFFFAGASLTARGAWLFWTAMRTTPEQRTMICPISEPYRGEPFRIDRNAQSAAPELPAFLAWPEDAPVYHGFPVVQESETDGWFYGAISDYECDTAQDDGDGFIVAPDDSRAGIVWDVEGSEFEQISPPDSRRWGVYGVRFPKPVGCVGDLVRNFRAVLPLFQAQYELIKDERTSTSTQWPGRFF